MEDLLHKCNFKRVLETSLAGIWLVDIFGKTLWINERIQYLLGYSPDEMIGLSVTDFLIGKNGHASSLARSESICDTSRDFQFTHKDGSTVTAIVSQNTMRDEADQFQCIVYMLIDISKRKDMEEDIRQRDAKLMDQNVMLTQKNAALREMVYQISQQRDYVERNVLENVHRLLLPIVERVHESGQLDSNLLSDLQQNVMNVTSSFSVELKKAPIPLSNREWEICRMIRSGLTSKEIAQTLSISVKSIQNHRNTIRKKLGISNKKVNLVRYLNSL